MGGNSLMRGFLACMCIVMACWGVNSQDKPPAQVAQEPAGADVASLDATVAAVYDVISGPAGQKRNWDRMRSLFIPGARLIPVATAGGVRTARVLTVDDYITRSSAVLEDKGFFEREVARRVERFGHIAHVFSTYESRREAADKAPFSRGINSFQLLNDGNRWWIVTVYWEAEGPDNPIPPEYLK